MLVVTQAVAFLPLVGHLLSWVSKGYCSVVGEAPSGGAEGWGGKRSSAGGLAWWEIYWGVK